MNTGTILRELSLRGVTLKLEGDSLRYRAPAGVLTPDLKAELARHKSEILAALRQGGTNPIDGPQIIDGKKVQRMIWETEKAVIFVDAGGRFWRYLPAFKRSWPVVVLGKRGKAKIENPQSAA